jgi:hypothetical protein
VGEWQKRASHAITARYQDPFRMTKSEKEKKEGESRKAESKMSADTSGRQRHEINLRL